LTVAVVKSTVRITGTPKTAGVYNVSVTIKNASGATFTKTLTITIHPPISTKLKALPKFALNKPYSVNLINTISGGVGPLKISISTSAALPRGMTIVNGVLSGIPRTAPSAWIYITVVDSVGTVFKQALLLGYSAPVRFG
jgi:hypothetical protein